MTTVAERLARLEGAYEHLATKADLANLKADIVKWFAGVLVLILINVIGTIVTLVVALAG